MRDATYTKKHETTKIKYKCKCFICGKNFMSELKDINVCQWCDI